MSDEERRTDWSVVGFYVSRLGDHCSDRKLDIVYPHPLTRPTRKYDLAPDLHTDGTCHANELPRKTLHLVSRARPGDINVTVVRDCDRLQSPVVISRLSRE